MSQLVPANLHESLWGPSADRGTVWGAELNVPQRRALADLAVKRAAALGFTIESGEGRGRTLDIPSPAVVLDREGRAGWVLSSIEEPLTPMAIEWRTRMPNDSPAFLK